MLTQLVEYLRSSNWFFVDEEYIGVFLQTSIEVSFCGSLLTFLKKKKFQTKTVQTKFRV